jgi:DNA polymerase III subunit delta'
VSDATNASDVLGGKLCPWLRPAFMQLDAAFRGTRLGHAWLIVGSPGIGKINLALALATRLLSPGRTEPGELDASEAVAIMAARHQPADHHPDLHWLFPLEDKATISIEQVREAIDALTLTAHGGGAKVVIVEPADALTTPAANALLKTLEEPSDNTYLLLVCHELGRIPATIRSRCQRLSVPRPPFAAAAAWLGGGTAAADAWQTAGGVPLLAAAIALSDENSKNKELYDSLAALVDDKISPQNIAEQWSKSDTAAALAWLMRELHGEIRQRLGAGDSTPVTDRGSATLHNPLRKLTLRVLFEQYDKAEKLAGQAGSGVNLELSLQALFGGLVATDKGRL